MWWDPWSNYGYNPYFPNFVLRPDDTADVKEESDYYHVYVNGDYVGDKLSVAQGDGGPDAVKDYLKSRGFDNFEVQYDGDRIVINSAGAEAESIKKHLSVYLGIR